MLRIDDFGLTAQEKAILLATRDSDCALSFSGLAAAVETQDLIAIHGVLNSLVTQQILRPLEQFDGHIAYAYTDADISQQIYEVVHQVQPL